MQDQAVPASPVNSLERRSHSDSCKPCYDLMITSVCEGPEVVVWLMEMQVKLHVATPPMSGIGM